MTDDLGDAPDLQPEEPGVSSDDTMPFQTDVFSEGPPE